MRALVIGGTLFIGRGIVAELLAEGHEVTILHRKPGHDCGKRVREIIADRNDTEALKSALAGKRFDVVFDNVYDWQQGTNADQVEGTAKLFDHLQRYVYMSSVAAYGDGLNHHEGDALAPDNHPDLYVRNKAMSERALFRLHQRNRFPIVTLRPPFIYGPGNPFYREAFFWDRLRDNRPIIVPGDGRRLMQFVHVKDVVTSAVRAATEPGVAGHAFNVANPRPITQMELVELFAEIAGKRPEIVRMPRTVLLQAGGHPMGPKLYFANYYDLPPITEIIAKAQRMLHLQPIDFKTGLKETYKWYLRHHQKNTLNYEFEDKLLKIASTLPPHQPEI